MRRNREQQYTLQGDHSTVLKESKQDQEGDKCLQDKDLFPSASLNVSFQLHKCYHLILEFDLKKKEGEAGRH